MKSKNIKKSGVFIFLIAIGCLWGIMEYFTGTFLKNLYPGNITGSVLIGFSFLFLSAAYFLNHRFSSLFVIFSISVLFKIAATLIIGKSLTDPFFVNPVLSMLLSILLFFLYHRFILKSRKPKGLNSLINGALLATATALLFPLINYASGFPLCYKSGTDIPLSVWYVHISAFVGFFAYPAGIFLSSLFNNTFSTSIYQK